MRTAKVTVPCRFAAQAAAPATSGSQPCAVAGQASAASSIATARRRIAPQTLPSGDEPRTQHPRGARRPAASPRRASRSCRARCSPRPTTCAATRTRRPTATGATPTRPGRRSSARSASSTAARTVVFSSGMAAVAAVVLPRLRPGDVLVACGDGYPGIRQIAARRPRAEGDRGADGADRHRGDRRRRRRRDAGVGRDALEPAARHLRPRRGARGDRRAAGGRQHGRHAARPCGRSTTAPTSP